MILFFVSVSARLDSIVYSGSCSTIFKMNSEHQDDDGASEITSSGGRDFTYTPLAETTNIRVLELRSADQDGVHTGLREVSFKDAIRLGYAALSYTWGPPDFSEKILVDGAQLSVTPNLLEALRSITSLKSRYLWVDAICINQTDLVEKSTQILLMTEIYRSTSLVHVWLREGSEDIRNLFDWVPKITAELRPILQEKSFSARTRALEIFQEHNKSTIITELFESSWFERLWTFQEVVVARSAQLVCGSSKLSWEAMLEFMSLVHDNNLIRSVLTTERAMKLWINVISLARIRARYLTYANTGGLDLIDLILMTGARKCFDSRDRLIALSGLTSGEYPLPYPTDYTKDVATFYTDFAVHSITSSSGLLRIFGFCRLDPRRMGGLPSWVPDWTGYMQYPLSVDTSVQHKAILEQGDFLVGGSYTWTSNKIVYSQQNEPHALFVDGIIVDTVKTVWKLPHGYVDDYTMPFLDWSHGKGFALKQFLLFCGPHSQNPIPWDILWRIMICDQPVSKNLPESSHEIDSKLVEACLDSSIWLWDSKEQKNSENPPSESEIDELWGVPLCEYRQLPLQEDLNSGEKKRLGMV